LRKKEPLEGVASRVIYNALSKEFVETANAFQSKNNAEKEFVVLMLCSLKDYKGVREFVALADALPNISFEIVLNATPEAIDLFFHNNTLPKNLTVFPQQSNVHQFYQRATLVLNLSHPEQWVETFGMTLLEGMQYGIPSIVPPVGGPAEIVQSGVNGYQIDQRHLEKLVNKIREIAGNPVLYKKLSQNAARVAKDFSVERMSGKMLEVVG